MSMLRLGAVGWLWVSVLAANAQQPAQPGAPKDLETRALEAGARLLQSNRPVAGMDIHLNGFHAMRDHPEHQMEAHHFCRQVTADFAQCVLFDGVGVDARLNGIEYIISERLFATLDETEKAYWHPHNGEILSGQLVAPGIPEAAEHRLMAGKINSYGKTWHVWNTGMAGVPADALPLGEPRLAWSFNRDGELDETLKRERDRRLGIDSEAKRRARADLRDKARPQRGVDAMKGRFGRSTQEIPGVSEAGR